MPGIQEGLYWTTGGLIYFLSTITCMWFIICFIKFYNNQTFKNFIVLSVVLILGIGVIEFSMMYLCLLTGIIWLYDLMKNKKNNYYFTILLITAIIFGAAIVFAPGNTIRAVSESKIMAPMDGKTILVKSILSSFKYLIIYFFVPGVLLSSIIIFLIEKEYLSVNSKLIFKKPILVFLFSVIVVFLGMFFIYNSLHLYLERHVNIFYFYFLIFFIYSLICFYYSYKTLIRRIIPISLLVSFVGLIIISISLKNNSIRAYGDLFFKVKEYEKQMDYRYELVRNAKSGSTIVLPPVKNPPLTIYTFTTEGFSENPNKYTNRNFATFVNPKVKIIQLEK